MGRRKKPTIEESNVEKRLEALKEELPVEEMEGMDLQFAHDLLREYAAVAEMASACRGSIEHDGILIEDQTSVRGRTKIKHVENPAFGTYYKITARMGDLATRTSKFIKQSIHQAQDEATDELSDY